MRTHNKPLSLQQIEIVEIDGLAITIDRNDQRQPNGDLGSGHCNHEQRKDLAVEILQSASRQNARTQPD